LVPALRPQDSFLHSLPLLCNSFVVVPPLSFIFLPQGVDLVLVLRSDLEVVPREAEVALLQLIDLRGELLGIIL
jgi:hypothetical protein